MSERRVFVIELESPSGVRRPAMCTVVEADAAIYQKMVPESQVVPYIPAYEAEEELEVYRLALRKACGAPSFIMTPPDPYDYVCRAREDIAAHKAKTKEKRKPHE